MEPNSQSSAPTNPPGESVVEFIAANRRSAAIGMFILAGILLLLGLFAFSKSRSYSSADSEIQKKSDEKKTDFNSFNLDDSSAKITDPNKVDYTVAAISAVGLLLIVLSGGLWLYAHPPALEMALQRTEIRKFILIVGAAFGFALMLIGGWYFYHWSSALADYMNSKETSDKKTIRLLFASLLTVVFGTAISFLAIQPARAEERSSSAVRKWVYGTNLGLGVLLLFVVLIVANIALSGQIPNKLDTTETGFYSLSKGTQEFLGRLDQPITAYAILPEGGDRGTDDIRRLLKSCEDESHGKFKVEFVNPTLNTSRYRTLVSKYPILETNEGVQGSSYGVLLTVGEDEKRHTFIREDDFVQQDQSGGRGRSSTLSFVGESKLMREVQYLSENQQKGVVYFTQSAGELEIESGMQQQVMPSASAARLKSYLEKNFLEVKPLTFDLNHARVPDDAAVVVVAEPQTPFTDLMSKAIKQYMTQPRPENKKGKLIVLASGIFGANGKIPRTGLEDLLAEFNVNLTDKVIFGEETREMDMLTTGVGFAAAAVQARNPVAMALGEKTGFRTPFWRPVSALNPQAQGPFKVVPLLVTQRGRITWLENEKPADLNKLFEDLVKHREIQVEKQLSNNARSVAVVVSEGESGRLAVIGNGLIFSDQLARQNQGGDPVTFDLLNATVDWLRDRPTVAPGIEAKKYKAWTFPIGSDEMRGLYLPLIFMMLVIAGAGAGIWVIRRK